MSPEPHFFLRPSAPFRLDLTVWTLRRRVDNLIDRWDGDTYRRVLEIEGALAEVAVTQVKPADAPRLRVTVCGVEVTSRVKTAVIAILNRLLGLQIDLSEFYRFADHEERLGELARRFRGMRPPRFPSIFESLVNAIACQQISLDVGILLLNRLTTMCGLPRGACGRESRAFPRPQDLARHDPSAIALLGFSRQKVRAMTELATAIADGQLDLEVVNKLSDQQALANLEKIRGVGRWTAEYVLLRGLGRYHIFPGDDVGARNNLVRWLGLSDSLDYDGVGRALGRWKQYSGLIYLHLLLDRLSANNYVK